MDKTGQATRRRLNDYRTLLRMVQSQRAFVAQMEKDKYALHSGKGEVRGSGGGKPVEQTLLRVEREEEYLKQLELSLQWTGAVVTAYLDSVTDPIAKAGMYGKYVSGLTWKQIAAQHGAGASESAIRMAVMRYTDGHPITWLI